MYGLLLQLHAYTADSAHYIGASPGNTPETFVLLEHSGSTAMAILWTSLGMPNILCAYS